MQSEQSPAYMNYLYSHQQKSVSKCVPLTAITEAIQERMNQWCKIISGSIRYYERPRYETGNKALKLPSLFVNDSRHLLSLKP